jgi:16S rRNA pseudouridine516 synthase
MRLDKYLASTTDYSRSEVKRWIKAGSVQINGGTITNAAYTVANGDQVALNNERIKAPENRYFMLNKPSGYICATQDSNHPIALDILQEPNKHKLQIAGRLDKDTTGLVLITDDGQWNHRVTAPSRQCFKYYRVTLAQPLNTELISLFEQGIQLHNDEHLTRPAQLHIIDDYHAELALQEGKYHQVKRMFAAVGNHVTNLHRYRIGNIYLDDYLLSGHYRPLNAMEITYFAH